MGFWVAVGTVAVTGLVPLLAWPSEGDPGSGIPDSPFDMIPLWLMPILVVMHASNVSMRSEVKKGILETLLVTRLPPASIILGSYFAFLAFIGLIFVLTAPMTVFYCRMGRPFDPERQELWLFLLVLLPVAGLKHRFAATLRKEDMNPWLRASDFGVPFAFLFCFFAFAQQSASLRHFLFAVFLAHATAMSLWFLKHADLRLLLQPPKKPTGVAGLLQGLPREQRRRWSKKPPLTFPDGVNPVFHRTRYFSPASLNPSLKSFLLFSIVSLVALATFTVPFNLDLTVYLFTAFFFLGAVTGSAATTAILVRMESDQETLDNLRATPLTVIEIVWGKLIGAFWMLSWRSFHISAAAVMALAAILFPMDTHLRVFSFLFIPAFAVVVALGFTAGFLGAALSRDTVQAVILAFAVFLAPLIVVPLLLGPMESLSRAMSPLVGYYAAVYEYRASNVFSPGAFLLSLPLGLALAGLQFFLAVRLLERKWMRGG